MQPIKTLLLPLLSGRGCTFECSFVIEWMKVLDLESNESIVEEIKTLKKNYGITYIAFSDELFMSSISRAVSLCEDFIKAGLNIKMGL